MTMTEDLLDIGIALFLLIGLVSVMLWDRRAWKHDLRRAAQEEEKPE